MNPCALHILKNQKGFSLYRLSRFFPEPGPLRMEWICNSLKHVSSCIIKLFTFCKDFHPSYCIEKRGKEHTKDIRIFLFILPLDRDSVFPAELIFERRVFLFISLSTLNFRSDNSQIAFNIFLSVGHFFMYAVEERLRF